MVTRMIDAATGRIFRDSIAQLQRDVHRELHRDAFTLWKRDRPLGSWDAGESREGWELLSRGTGSLAENGAGGPTESEGIVFPDSPYKFRTAVAELPADDVDGQSAPDRSHLYLVLNGARLFAVDAIKREGKEDLLANVYLRELFNQQLPEEVAP